MENQKESTITNATQERNKIFFCVNLEDETNEQILHLEFTDKYRFALMGVFNGKNPSLTFGKYNIEQIYFDIKTFDDKPKLYIRKVEFVAFVENENGVKNIAKFKVDVSLEKQPPENRIYKSPDVIVKRDAILDMDFTSSDNAELDEFLQEQKEKADKIFNFGGHICKSRIAF